MYRFTWTCHKNQNQNQKPSHGWCDACAGSGWLRAHLSKKWLIRALQVVHPNQSPGVPHEAERAPLHAPFDVPPLELSRPARRLFLGRVPRVLTVVEARPVQVAIGGPTRRRGFILVKTIAIAAGKNKNFKFRMGVGKWKWLQVDVSKISQNGGIWYPTICWWPKISGKKKKPGKVSRSCRICRYHMDGIAFVSQQQALKSQWGLKPTVKLSAMKLVQCTVYCAFKCSCSHGPVIKTKTKQNQFSHV